MSAQTKPSEFDLSQTRVAILGMGLIGGSLALALHGHCAALLGADPSAEARSLAEASGVFEAIAADPADILPDADAIILAAPVRAILALLDELPHLPAAGVVMDVGSTKTEITERMKHLPPRYEPIGGHPMAGKEHGGFANAEKGLFRDAPFVLTPLPNTTERARSFALSVVKAVGARPIWLDAPTHDRYAAAVSHLPYLLSLALVTATPTEAACIAGPGFRSTSRLASTPPSMMGDILATNRAAVSEALQRFRHALDALEQILRQGAIPESVLAEGVSRHASLLSQIGKCKNL